MPARRRPTVPTTLMLLVRHGQTATTGKILPGRARGLHLSDDGRAQAEATADRLGVLPRVDAVYSSPLERARETAVPIGRRLGLKVVTDRGLLECDYGDWTGGELKALSRTQEWRVVQRHPSGFRFPGGESFPEMLTRFTATLRRLCAAHPGGVVVAVSHADPIRLALADALGAHLDHFQRVVVSPASVSAVAYGELGTAVLTVNATGDLAQLVPRPRPRRRSKAAGR